MRAIVFGVAAACVLVLLAPNLDPTPPADPPAPPRAAYISEPAPATLVYSSTGIACLATPSTTAVMAATTSTSSYATTCYYGAGK